MISRARRIIAERIRERIREAQENVKGNPARPKPDPSSGREW